ncbi:unnamed protein product [Diplocarpon coronariae]
MASRRDQRSSCSEIYSSRAPAAADLQSGIAAQNPVLVAKDAAKISHVARQVRMKQKRDTSRSGEGEDREEIIGQNGERVCSNLTKQQLMSFFATTPQPGKFVDSPDHERIPDNWYKRAIGDEYTIPGFLAEVLDFGPKYRPLLSVGGSTAGDPKCTLLEGKIGRENLSITKILLPIACNSVFHAETAYFPIISRVFYTLSKNRRREICGLGCFIKVLLFSRLKYNGFESL